ncbi:microviridin/marinostatin family tricyclic proteinase inhibitor [Crocosphaera sp. XPORK-15E]|nr:microviridin/marinostatin family tricyclic proteinase inhibitor [Crocosphaera sp. XPORK-15E]MEA5536927.1 microviridin/marinostatin family tricyclic proteinase inhibitor [Crocosphaera sp. XPORK-15E]
MSKNTTKEVKSVPFFVRFLEEEPPQPEETPTPDSPQIFTLKFPSDWEDY